MPVVDWVRNFLGFGWIRDLLGIRKDLIDAKKSKLEVERLEDEKRGRELITRASLEDVKAYDPKVILIESRIKDLRVIKSLIVMTAISVTVAAVSIAKLIQVKKQSPERVVAGRVADAGTGKSIGGVKVTLVGQDVVSEMTDSEGLFLIRLRSQEGTVRVRVEAPGFRTYVEYVPVSEDARPVTIFLQRTS